MAQKIYSIKINGLSESVAEVETLAAEIEQLEKRLNKMGKTTTGNIVDKSQVELQKEIRKNLELSNEEYLKNIQNTEKIKQQNKEIVKINKEIAQGIRNQNGEFANTLQGQRAYLAELKKTLSNLDLNDEGWDELRNKVLEVNESVKELEKSYGVFNREVGHYENATKGIEEVKRSAEELIDIFKELAKKDTLNVTDLKQYGLTIAEVETQLQELENKKRNSVLGSQEYEELMNQEVALKKVNNEYKRLSGQIVRADNQLKTQLQRTIQGTTYTWENLTSAVGELEDKLYKLAANGQTNTDEFRELSREAVSLKTALQGVDYQIDMMVEGGSGLGKMLSFGQGFAGLASIGTGIQQLFGGSDEDSMKQMQTMTSLIGVLEGIRALSYEMSRKTPFGEFLNKMNESFNRLLISMGLMSDGVDNIIKSFGILKEKSNEWDGNMFQAELDTTDALVKLFPELNGEFKKAAELAKMIDDSFNIQNFSDVEKLRDSLAKIINENGGLDNLDKLDQQTKDLMEVLQRFDEIGVAASELERNGINSDALGLGWFEKSIASVVGWFKKYLSSAEDIVPANLNVSNSFRVVANGMKVAEKAGKALRTALKALIIFELINLLMKAIDGIKTVVSKIWEWTTGNDKLVDSLKVVESQLEFTRKSIEKYNQAIDDATNKDMSNLEAVAKKFANMEEVVKANVIALQEMIAAQKKLRGLKLEDNLSAKGLTQSFNINNIQGFRKEYDQLMKAVAAGTDMWSFADRNGGWLANMWFTKKDAKSDLAILQKRVIQDVNQMLSDLDVNNIDALDDFFTQLEDEMYATSIAALENLFPEEEWAKVLKMRLDALIGFYEQMKQASKDAELEIESRDKAIRDNKVQAMSKAQSRELEQLRNQRKDEIKAAGDDLELVQSIIAKYDRLEQDLVRNFDKDYNSKLSDLFKAIRDNYLEGDENSLEKELTRLENERQDALDKAWEDARESQKQGEDMTIVYNELMRSINAKYDKIILDAKDDYYNALKEKHLQYQRELFKINQGIATDALEFEQSMNEIQQTANEQSSDWIFDFDASFKERLENEKRFNLKRLDLEIDFLKNRNSLDLENARLDKEDEIEAERDRYNQALRSLKESLRNGQVSREEYNDIIEKENELHSATLIRIEAHWADEVEKINRQHFNDMKSATSKALGENARLYENYGQEVQRLMSRVNTMTNSFGFFKYEEMKTKMEEALSVVKDGITDIDREMSRLNISKMRGAITDVEYNERVTSLKQTKEDLVDQSNEISLRLDTLFGQTVDQWAQFINEYVQEFINLFSKVADMQYENEMARIEQEQETLDKENEMLQEAYDAKEEIVQKYADNINTIEDELESARGDRRMFLLEQLNEEMVAREKAFEQQKRIEQQQLENQRKQEELERQQEAVEARRRQSQKRIDIAQATAQTALGVTRTLGAYAYPTNAILAALVGALGAAQIGIIAATKYASGGLLQGPSHSQGGIKVLGGTAEVEGNEYITNKVTTMNNLELLEFINSQKRRIDLSDLVEFYLGSRSTRSLGGIKFADGGQLPNPNIDVRRLTSQWRDDRPIFVSVTEIESVQNRIRNVRALAGDAA